MKNPELHGIGTVLRYTVQQHYKTPSIIVFLVILFLLAVCSMPAILLFSGHEQEVMETQIHTLYLRNESGFPLDAAAVQADARYAALTVVETDEDDDALSERVLKEKNAAARPIRRRPRRARRISSRSGRSTAKTAKSQVPTPKR